MTATGRPLTRDDLAPLARAAVGGVRTLADATRLRDGSKKGVYRPSSTPCAATQGGATRRAGGGVGRTGPGAQSAQRRPGLDEGRLRLCRLAMRLSLVAGPLRLLDGDFPFTESMRAIAEHNLVHVLDLVRR